MQSDTAQSPPAAETRIPHDGQGKPHTDNHPRQAVSRIGALIAELKEYFAYYLSAKVDGYKVSARKIGMYAVLGILGLIAGAALVSTAVVLLVVGVALGFGQLFGYLLGPQWAWLGSVLVGLLVLAGIALVAIMGLKKLTGTFRKQTVKKYEQRQQWETGQFGRNIPQRAAARD